MPAPTKIYFGQIASKQWQDWVQVINVSNEDSQMMAVARNEKGQTVWSGDKSLRPFQAWVIPIDPVSVNQELSLVVSSNKPLIGERHCHLGTEVLAFPGAAPEQRSVGRRLFFPELSGPCRDWFRIFNISEQTALVNMISRDLEGAIVKQFGSQIGSLGFIHFSDEMTGNVYGSLEVISTQTIVSERHLHYAEVIKGVAVGQLGQVLDPPTPTTIYFPQIAAGAWLDWVKIVNVSQEQAKLTALARNDAGQAVWSSENTLRPFQTWIVPVDPIAKQKDVSLTISSNKQVSGERHCHLETMILAFPGACPEMKTAGRRLFFPEIVAGSYDFFRFLNITDQTAMVNGVIRDTEGIIKLQFSFQIPPFGYTTATDQNLVDLQGTLEILSTQIIVGERHLRYGPQSYKGVTIGQFGQVLD
jgi:hypothetical protein